MYVYQFAWNNSSFTGRIFMKFDTWVFFENLSRKFKFRWNLTNNEYSWRIKCQLDVTCYFISLLMCSTCLRILIYPSSGACHYCVELPHWSYCSWFDECWSFGVETSRKLLMVDILMSETCWAHKKRNKITSDIKLVFYSSTITIMHGPINIKNDEYILPRRPMQICNFIPLIYS